MLLLWLLWLLQLLLRGRCCLLLLLLLRLLLSALARRRHATARDAFEYTLQFRCAVRKGMAPECIARILDQLNEADEQTPRMGSVNYEPLEKDASDLLLHL
jgi:hypothetical protein